MRAVSKENGAKSKIFFCFVVFTAVTLVLLVVLQVFFLKYIYRSIKIGEMREAANEVASAYNEDRFYSVADKASDKYGVCMQLFDPTSGDRKRLSAAVTAGCMLYDLSGNDCMTIYMKVSGSGKKLSVFDLSVTPERPGFRDGQRMQNAEISDFSLFSGSEQGNVVLARLIETENGDNVLLMVNAYLTPVSTVTGTIGVIIAVISVILVVLAAVMAGYLSGNIAKPLIRMNNRAKLLGEGNYDVRFDENAGYREADELASTLNRAAAELSKVEELRRELIANLSHDLRTPLTLISGYSEIMRDIPGEVTPENLQTIIDEVGRLSSLVNDMLEVSKIQSGNVTPHPEDIDLSEELDRILQTYKTLAGRMGYEIILEKTGDGHVCADRSLIVRAVMNLINNAMTYTGEDKKVIVRMTGRESAVRVEVSDSGAGIPPEKLNLIWDRYYKVDSEHKRAQQGSGLGLSIVKSALGMHGGKYGVRSREGSGTTFWIELPRDFGSAITDK